MLIVPQALAGCCVFLCLSNKDKDTEAYSSPTTVRCSGLSSNLSRIAVIWMYEIDLEISQSNTTAKLICIFAHDVWSLSYRVRCGFGSLVHK